MRAKPGLWLPLPTEVTDARSLAAHLRAFAAAGGEGRADESPGRELLAAAALLDACAPGDAACLRAVVAALDARAAACAGDGAADERRYWESIAHAVERVADAAGFWELCASMQTPEVRAGTERGIKATPEEMARAAVAAARREAVGREASAPPEGAPDEGARDEGGRDEGGRDEVHPPLALDPDREAERRGELRCHRCGAPARWDPWGDAWVPACAEHAPEDDWT